MHESVGGWRCGIADHIYRRVVLVVPAARCRKTGQGNTQAMNKTVLFLPLLMLVAGVLPAHEGDAEDRAMRLLGLQQQLDKTWLALQREAEPVQRVALLKRHAQALLDAQEALRDAAENSPCIMLEKQDTARQLACLVDTEARLRATERILGHVINRVTLSEK